MSRNFQFSSMLRLTFMGKCRIIEISIDAVEAEQRALIYLLLILPCGPAEMIVAAHSFNINSTEGRKRYARSYPSYISRTDRV